MWEKYGLDGRNDIKFIHNKMGKELTFFVWKKYGLDESNDVKFIPNKMGRRIVKI